jgi:hypothetical protein
MRTEGVDATVVVGRGGKVDGEVGNGIVVAPASSVSPEHAVSEIDARTPNVRTRRKDVRRTDQPWSEART